jgi:hypothetical protein
MRAAIATHARKGTYGFGRVRARFVRDRFAVDRSADLRPLSVSEVS